MKLNDTIEVFEHLEKFGYAIQKNVIPKEDCEKMAKELDEIKKEKSDKKAVLSTNAQTTIFNIHLEKPDIFLDKIDLPQVMSVVSQVLKEEFILSNFNASLSGSQGGNRIHIDSRVPTKDFSNTLQIVALLCLDDFTPENGCTRIWPESHKSGIDPRSLRGSTVPGSKEEFVPKGSVIYTLGQTWHDVGPNTDGSRRWGIIAYYSRWWIKPTFDFTQCGEEMFNKLNQKQKTLFGFSSRPPFSSDKRVHTLIPSTEILDDYKKTLEL